MPKREKVYYDWECPKCGDYCSDPEETVCTQCRNGHSVVLGDVIDGERDCSLRSDE